MPAFSGLQTNFATWLIVTAMIAVWMLSVRLVPGWATDGWPSILKSLYGIVWLDFGLDVVLRFLMLSYNAVEWGNGSPRLIAIDTEIVNRSLLYCGLFWLLVTVAYRFAVRRRGAGPLAVTQVFTPDFAYQAAIPVALLASAASFLIEGGYLPLSLLTPVGLLSALYVVPAVIVWWHHFSLPGPKWRIGSIHLIVLLPALVKGYCSPYRENLAPVVLIPLIAAIFAGKRPSLRKLIPAALLCLFVLSAMVSSYRRIKWDNVRPEEVAYEFKQASFVDWVSGTWAEPMHRFHGFDSMLMTVMLVPSMMPHSGRNVLVAPLVRGFIPRFLNSDKEAADSGMNFGTQIWGYSDPVARDHGGASIAPTMPGDLFDAGGVLYIVLGSFIWGSILGLVDGWKGHLPEFSAAATTILVATQCGMSVERDFNDFVAGFIQTLLVFVLASGLLMLARPRSPEFVMAFDPKPERP